jgi:hypothetical protein
MNRDNQTYLIRMKVGNTMEKQMSVLEWWFNTEKAVKYGKMEMNMMAIGQMEK